MGKRQSNGPLQVEFICPKCKKRLAWAVPTVSMSCPKCGTWVTDQNRLTDSGEIYLPVDSDQLVLFKE